MEIILEKTLTQQSPPKTDNFRFTGYKKDTQKMETNYVFKQL